MSVAMENFVGDTIPVPRSQVRLSCHKTGSLFICRESADRPSSVFLILTLTKAVYRVCRSTSVAIWLLL